MTVTVCMLVGREDYVPPAAVAVEALLLDTRFDLLIAHTPGVAAPGTGSPRVATCEVPATDPAGPRSHRFLRKFHALAACLERCPADWILQVDADVVLARPLRERDLAAAVGGADFGMVEQPGIRGSDMNRAAFLDHYRKHALALLDPGAAPPPEARFRYYNSGVVIGRREAWERLVTWALATLPRGGDHEVAEHMVADQDYFQYWTNTRHPGCCADLPWYWNHCEHWDEGFPRRGVLFAHFSNFCHGPAPETPARMRALRRPWTRLLNRCTPPSSL